MSMVRQYKRKRDPRGRMLRAVELRTQGMSLRQIAEALGVKSPQTVLNDLARWEREHPPNVTSLSKTTVQKMPPGGEKWTQEMDSSATVIPLRKATHG